MIPTLASSFLLLEMYVREAGCGLGTGRAIVHNAEATDELKSRMVEPLGASLPTT